MQLLIIGTKTYTFTEVELNLKLSIFLSCFLLAAACKSMASQPSITGSNLSSLIVEHLTNIGVKSTLAINSDRVFFGCAKEDIRIKKRELSWKTIQLTCKKNKEWTFTFRNKLELPENNMKFGVNRSLTNKKLQTKKRAVFVLAVDKSKGDKINKSDVMISTENNLLTRNAFEEIKPILGKMLKRSLKKGAILKENHLQPAWLVYKNQRITIENSIGEIRVTMEGIALKNGARGDRILARNISSKKTIEGFVVGDKKITIFRKIY